MIHFIRLESRKTAPGCSDGSIRGSALVAWTCQRGLVSRSYSPSNSGPNRILRMSSGRQARCVQGPPSEQQNTTQR